VFFGLAARVRASTFCALARNSALFAILISTRLISAILNGVMLLSLLVLVVLVSRRAALARLEAGEGASFLMSSSSAYSAFPVSLTYARAWQLSRNK
jgi:hypothetical protein